MLPGRSWPRAARRAGVAAALAWFAMGCSDTVPVGPPPTVSETGASPGFSLLPLDLFGIGPVGGRPCSAPAYRDFDFWVGNWDVYGGSTTNLAGTNEVKSLLGGCAVEENWVAAFGSTGRSLNAYDHATGTWSQMWVAVGGCPFSVILVEGGIVNGAMRMTGRREQPEGFLIAPPCGPPPGTVVFSRADLIRWTPLATGSVLQQFSAANNDAPLNEPPPPDSMIGFRYDPVETVTPLPRPPRPSFCPFRAGAQQFNFMVGTWAVHQGNGLGAQGSATFRKDQTDCLVEERFEGLGGYEGISYNTFDVFTQQWVRTYVDNQGQRLMLTGGLQDGVMVLSGTKGATGGQVIGVRVSWAPVSGDEVVQTWEFAPHGDDWQVHRTLRYTRTS
jgi:hypothetical protein